MSKSRPLTLARVAGRVDDRELGIRVGFGRGLGGVGQQEADGDDQVLVLREELVDVLLVVGLLLALQVDAVDAQFLDGVLDTVPGGLVEGLVVDAAHVGHLANGEGCLEPALEPAQAVLGGRRFGGRRGLSSHRGRGRCCLAAAAGGHEHRDDHKGHQHKIETLLHGEILLLRTGKSYGQRLTRNTGRRGTGRTTAEGARKVCLVGRRGSAADFRCSCLHTNINSRRCDHLLECMI